MMKKVKMNMKKMNIWIMNLIEKEVNKKSRMINVLIMKINMNKEKEEQMYKVQLISIITINNKEIVVNNQIIIIEIKHQL